MLRRMIVWEEREIQEMEKEKERENNCRIKILL